MFAVAKNFRCTILRLSTLVQLNHIVKASVHEHDDVVDVAGGWKSLEYVHVANDVCRATGGGDRLHGYLRKCQYPILLPTLNLHLARDCTSCT